MSDVSETKLAGLTLMLGPSLATLLYIIFIAIPSILSSTSIDQMDWSVIAREQSELDIWVRLPLLLVPVFLTFSVFGFSVLSETLEKFSHFYKAGMNFFVANIIISAAAWGVTQSIVWLGAPGWPAAVVSAGMASYAGFLGSIGMLIIALSVSANKDSYNQSLSYIVSAFMFLGILIQGVILLDRTEYILSIANPLTGFTYVVFSVWAITLGRKLYQQ